MNDIASNNQDSVSTAQGETVGGDQEFQTHPLSYGQQAQFFIYEDDKQSPAYNITFTIRILSDVDAGALKSAFQSLVDRHPALRTTYAYEGIRPVQRVHEHQQVSFEEVDASGWDAEETRQQIQADYRKPFDLEHGPVTRATLYTSADKDHVFSLTTHHIAVDGWSHWKLFNELEKLYLANLTHQGQAQSPIELPAQEYHYTDYVKWQHEMLQGAEGARLEKYWQQQLGGSLPDLDLPTDFPRPPKSTYEGSSHSFAIDKALTDQLKGLSKSKRSTLYMTLVAAFQVFLHRYSGQHDILLGTPFSGRTRPEFSEVVGDFFNTVVLRGDLSGSPTFDEYLKQVRGTVLDAMDHQDYPFSLLVNKLQVKRDSSRTPVFQVMFNYLKPVQVGDLDSLLTPVETKSRAVWAGLELESYYLAQQEGQFDLVFEIVEADDTLYCVFKYRTDLFARSTMQRMSANFEALLRGIAAQPEANVGDLPVLSVEERDKLLVDWNATATDYPQDKCAHHVFEEQAQRNPDAIAVEFEGQTLSYRELNERANHLANYLKSIGVGKEVLVGLFVERSLDMMVGLVGIAKSGGAYVPMDADYPQQRLDYMREHSELKYIVTQQSLKERLGDIDEQVVCMDADWDAISQSSGANPQPDAELDNLVYVIYTSGSTGKPKGVQVFHRGLVNLMHAMAKRPGLTSDDRLLAITTISFDLATPDIWLPLVVGATMVVATRNDSRDGGRLLQKIKQDNITAMQATPSTWRMLLASGWDESYPFKVLCGGEGLPRDLADQILQTKSELHNQYGPTETTVWSSNSKVEATDEPIVVGRPIANTQFYILDDRLQPKPVGVPGELYIGGHGVARGYLNRPDLTEERFVPNPFPVDCTKTAASNIYRTGDLARFLPDGTVEHLGRLDNQVKVRGYRIELGEIESVLGQHEAVVDNVVIAREDQPGNKQLVAYVVTRDGSTLSQEEVRTWLKLQLPGYMVPAIVVNKTELPLNVNGKVDRLVLSQEKLEDVGSVSQFQAPQDVLERQLTSIWQSVLGRSAIGVTDNFFDLGGHSFLAISLFDQIEKLVGEKLPISMIFQTPTIKEFAETLRSGDWQPRWKSLVAVREGGSKRPLILLPPAGVTGMFYGTIAPYLDADRPVYSFDSSSAFDFDTVESLVAHYIEELRTVFPTGPYLLGGMCFGAHLSYEMAQQLTNAGEQVNLVAMIDSGAPENGPTWKAPPPPKRTPLYYVNQLRYHLREGTMRSVFKRRRMLVQAKYNERINQYMSLLEWQSKMRSKYEAVPYDGNMVLVLSEQFANRENYVGRWRALSVDKFEHVAISGVKHLDLAVGGPKHFRQLAEIIERFVTDADEQDATDVVEEDAGILAVG